MNPLDEWGSMRVAQTVALAHAIQEIQYQQWLSMHQQATPNAADTPSVATEAAEGLVTDGTAPATGNAVVAQGTVPRGR